MTTHSEIEKVPSLFHQQVGFGKREDILNSHLTLRRENIEVPYLVDESVDTDRVEGVYSPRHWLLQTWSTFESMLGFNPDTIGRLRSKFVNQYSGD